MWQAAVGALIGYLFALWWVGRSARTEVDAAREALRARLDSREAEITGLRTSLEASRSTVADYQRRLRYLESAITASAEAAGSRRAPRGTPVTPAG